ncbi:unknown [Clostridium sp. CAG:964]|nr:LPXTG cell wall anchor domain-containing protein [Acutalibacteraceae bacterium]CDC78043.1 unknown [Clostridium sp. CAG:964]
MKRLFFALTAAVVLTCSAFSAAAVDSPSATVPTGNISPANASTPSGSSGSASPATTSPKTGLDGSAAILVALGVLTVGGVAVTAKKKLSK